MNSITIGPFVLSIPLLIWAISAFAGFGVLRLRMKDQPEAQTLGSVLSGAVLLWLLCWKLSLLVFDPYALRGGPMALLYFHGGVRGAWAAGAVTMIYVVWAARKQNITKHALLDAGLVFILGAYTARMALLFVWGDGNPVTLGILALLGAGVLFRWLFRSAHGSFQTSLQLVLVFIIGHMMVNTLGSHLWEKSAAAASASTVGLKIGQQAPDFVLNDTNGTQAKLSDLRNHTVVVNFWATWCPPCRAEMPEMQNFHESDKERKVSILAINATNTETSSGAVSVWLKQKGYTFPVAYDANGETAKTYRISAFPSTYIIGPDGVIRDKHQGPMNAAMLRVAVDKAAAE